MRDKEYIKETAAMVAGRIPDNYGFIILVAPMGEGGRMEYSSNVNREDAIKVLKEFLFQIGEAEAWMQHIK